jgi:hypothetical protein
MLAVADASLSGDDASRAALIHSMYRELMFSVAGVVAEVKIAGYPADHVEKDVAGRTPIPWDAVRVASAEAGLPICGHKDCEIPFDAERVAEVIRRAEDEVFAMLEADRPAVERVANALCRQDRLTTIELDALMAGPASAGKRRRRLKPVRPKRRQAKQRRVMRKRAIVGNDGARAS